MSAGRLRALLAKAKPKPITSGIIPNPVQAATTIAGATTASFTAPRDTGGRSHFIEYTAVAVNSNVRAFVFAEIDDDNGIGSGGWGYYCPGATNQLIASSRNLAGSITGNLYPNPGNMTGAVWAPGARIRTQLTPDKRMQHVINDVVVWDQDWTAGYDAEPNDRGVFLSLPTGASVQDVTYGQYNVPLTVQNQQLLASYVPQAVLKYTGTPYGYRVQIETSGGAVLVASAPVEVVLSTQGSLVVKGTTGAPVSAFGSSINVRWMEVDSAGNTVRSVAVASQMPDQPAKFGMNLSATPYYGTDRMYKDLTLDSVWTQISNNAEVPLATSGFGINTTYFNQMGQLIALPSGGVQRRIIRCTVPGSRCKLEWRGYTVALNNDTGAGANRSAVTTTGGISEQSFDFNFTWAQFPNLQVQVTGIDTNVPEAQRFIRCAEVGTVWDSNVIHDEWIARHAQFNVQRFMDLMGSNDSLPYGRSWDVERPRAGVYGRQTMGMPPEYIIEIANRTGAIPWINLPGIVNTADQNTADDTIGYAYTVKFVRGLLFGEGMAGGVKLNSTAAGRLIIEIANEWFNANFSIYTSAAQISLARGRATQAQYDSGGRYTAVLVEEAYQVNRHFQALTNSLTPTELQAIVRVLGHNPNTSSMGNLVNGITGQNGIVYKVESQNYDAMTCAFYFGAGMNNEPSTGTTAYAYTTNLDTLFQRYNDLMDSSFNSTLLMKNFAKSKGKRFMMYEGQGHYVAGAAPGGIRTDTEWYNPTLYAAFQQDDRQRIAIRRWANLAASGFGDVICAYAAVGDNGPNSAQYGQWGFLNNPQGQATSVKQIGYLQAKVDQGV